LNNKIFREYKQLSEFGSRSIAKNPMHNSQADSEKPLFVLAVFVSYLYMHWVALLKGFDLTQGLQAAGMQFNGVGISYPVVTCIVTPKVNE
jgi:hypothetical protein